MAEEVKERLDCLLLPKKSRVNKTPRLLVVLSGYVVLEDITNILIRLINSYRLMILCDSMCYSMLEKSKLWRLFSSLKFNKASNPAKAEENETDTDINNDLVDKLLRWCSCLLVASMDLELLSEAILLSPAPSLLVEVTRRASKYSKPCYYNYHICNYIHDQEDVKYLLDCWHEMGWLSLFPEKYPAHPAPILKSLQDLSTVISNIKRVVSDQEDQDEAVVKRCYVRLRKGVWLLCVGGAMGLCSLISYCLYVILNVYTQPVMLAN